MLEKTRDLSRVVLHRVEKIHCAMCVTTCCFINPCLLFFQSKIRRKKSKWSKSEDEGFESPNSPPLSPVDHQPESFPEPQKAPLANEEDLDSVEKYETEVTKEKDGEPKKELSVRIFNNIIILIFY